jgi:hypothetical protein
MITTTIVLLAGALPERAENFPWKKLTTTTITLVQ